MNNRKRKKAALARVPAAGSVEADGVQEGPAALLLKLLQQLVDLVLHVLRVLDLGAEKPPERGRTRMPGRAEAVDLCWSRPVLPTLLAMSY